MRTAMTSTTKLAIAGTFACVAMVAAGTALRAKPISYQLPEETAALKKAPGLDVVESNCGACHSADYIQTQPRGPKFKTAFWKAEVEKMIKVYGAQIEEADVPKIVDYLAANY
jgi:mono/diheme cytochrome c family protein